MSADPIAKAAHQLIAKAAGRLMNDDYSIAGTPARTRHVETMQMLWDAMGLIWPEGGHPDDTARHHEARAENLDSSP